MDVENFNLYFDVIADLGDFKEAGILCFLLGQKENNNVKVIQKWQQTIIAKLMHISVKTVKRKLESLREKGFLTYRATTNDNNLKTTQIILSEKALKYKIDDD